MMLGAETRLDVFVLGFAGDSTVGVVVLAALLMGLLGYVGARVWNATLRREVEARTSQFAAIAEEKDRLAASLAERERLLRASEERYELAAEATLDAIWDWSVERKNAIWTPAVTRVFGHPLPSLKMGGGWWEEKIHPEDRAAITGAFHDLLQGQSNRLEVSYRFARADGSYAYVTDRAIVLRDKAGKPLRMIGAITDVTGRKEAEAERERLIANLEAQNAELERFTYTVSHDLKSPLVTIGSYLGLLEKTVASGDMAQFKSDLARIQRAAHRMRRLLDELLDLSRVGRVANPEETVSLLELAREAADLVRGRLKVRDVEIRIAENLPAVRGDRIRLLEVMLNLIDNAAKFSASREAPCIEVGVSPQQPDPSFFVRDNGTGIDPQHHEKVFGLFDKLDPSSEGTGIGLALVRRIVEAHGGRVWIESMGRGEGTTVHVALPA